MQPLCRCGARRRSLRRPTWPVLTAMLAAAQAAGVRRFIYISSDSAHWKFHNMIDMDESWPYANESGIPFPYPLSKAEAERRVVAASTSSFATIVLVLRMVWGPGDRAVLPTTLKMAKLGKFAWVGGGAAVTATTHVHNLVHAIELSLTRGRSGQAYLVCDNGTTTLRDFFSALIATQNVPVPTKTVPLWLIKYAAYVLEPLWTRLWKDSEPPVTSLVAFVFTYDCTLNISKAKKELGCQPLISREEGMRTMPILGC